MRTLSRCAWRILVALCLGSGASPAVPAFALDIPPFQLPPGFVRDELVSGLTFPTAFAIAPDGRIFVAEKEGYVRTWKDGILYGQPLLDIRDEVNSYIDRGLVGFAVDPAFDRNGYVYALYVHDAPGQLHNDIAPRKGRVVRYTVDGDTADPYSARVLLDDFDATTQFHAVGSLRFSPLDGALFVSLGDGAYTFERSDLAYRSQDRDSLNGKLLRLDPATGDGLPDNPFFDVSHPHSARSRVWSYGHRNAFRFGIQPVTGIPYVGNVGWSTYESVQRATAGANFGWPCVEGILTRPEYVTGTVCNTVTLFNVTPSEFDYPHKLNNASVTGGAFDTGHNWPDEYYGNYFFSDYSTQRIWRANVRGDGHFASVEPFVEGAGEVVDLQFGPDGAMYYLTIYSGGLRRIKFKDGPLGSLVTASPTARPARILGPGDGDVFRAGETLNFIGAGNDSIAQYWWVTTRDRNDASVTTPLIDGAMGLTATVAMPVFATNGDSNADGGYVEVTFATVSPRGEVSVSRVNVYPQSSDGYIRTWLLTRSYPAKFVDDNVLGSEDTFTTSIDDKAMFPIRSVSRLIDLKDRLSPNQENFLISNMVGYAFIWVVVPTDREALIGINTDESFKVFLNGQGVFDKRVERPVADDTRDIDQPRVKLKTGANALLIKVQQTKKSNETWVFKARVLNGDGSLMTDAVVRTR